MPLLAQVLGSQALLYSTTETGGRSGDPTTSVALLAQAVELADRYAPQVVRSWLHAFLAVEHATAGTTCAADVHLERAAQALQLVDAGAPMPWPTLARFGLIRSTRRRRPGCWARRTR